MEFKYLISLDFLWLPRFPKGVGPDSLQWYLFGEGARDDVLTLISKSRNVSSMTPGWLVGWLVGFTF